MSKRKYWKTKKKYKPSRIAEMVDNLHKVIKKGYKADRGQCQEMITYYVRKGYLTSEMKQAAKLIIDANWSIIKPRPLLGRHYLYGISDGEFIKIGMSKNYEERMKNLQTSTPNKLSLVWCCYVSEDSREARRQEKKLHRACKAHHVRGEWFTRGCVPIMESWVIKNRSVREEEKGEELNSALDEQFRLIIG